nr:MAG TPA: hypothetical protein [Bacteriophage sp.]
MFRPCSTYKNLKTIDNTMFFIKRNRWNNWNNVFIK